MKTGETCARYIRCGSQVATGQKRRGAFLKPTRSTQTVQRAVCSRWDACTRIHVKTVAIRTRVRQQDHENIFKSHQKRRCFVLLLLFQRSTKSTNLDRSVTVSHFFVCRTRAGPNPKQPTQKTTQGSFTAEGFVVLVDVQTFCARSESVRTYSVRGKVRTNLLGNQK